MNIAVEKVYSQAVYQIVGYYLYENNLNDVGYVDAISNRP